MPDPITIVGVVLSAASLLYSENTRRVEKKADRYDERDAAATNKDAAATELILKREEFIREITGQFKTIGNQTMHLEKLQEILIHLESRITSILSDYTSLLNQISIVSTLMLGVATAIFGALLGNTEDQPPWKVNMYVISCILTICFSIVSVIESFFLSIHIYAEESKFTAGLFPHRATGTRIFELVSLKGLSKSYSASIITFFMSFMFFSTSLLSMMYIGLGKSIYILGEDDRYYKDYSDRFSNVTDKKVSEVEPEYTGIAFTMTLIVIITYVIILGLFMTKYRKYVLWPKKILECCGEDKESLKEPMRATANDFERIQIELHDEFETWQQLFDAFTQQYDHIYAQQHSDRTESTKETDWNYTDVSYERYVYQAFREQLVIQRKILVQMRMLQVTDKAKRRTLNYVANNYETKTDRYSKLKQIYF